jgi:basic membrane protein A
MFIYFKIHLYCLFFLLLLPSVSIAKVTVGFLVPVSGLGDQSFNDITYAGLVRARNDFGFTLVIGQCEASPQSHKFELLNMLDENVDIIVANGWEFEDLIREYAPKNPEKIFIINDVAVSGMKNVISSVYSQHEGAFLAGTLAALVTKTDKIGFVGGMNIPVIASFERGFIEGVQYINKNIELFSKYLAGDSKTGVGFHNPKLGYSVAHELYDNSVDVIFSVAGLSGNGVIRAAAERKLYVIGVDADQDHMAKGYVLSSVMKRMDIAVYAVLSEVIGGSVVPGVHHFNLENGGVSLTHMLFSREVVTDEVRYRLQAVKEKIIAQKIKVTNTLQVSSTFDKNSK